MNRTTRICFTFTVLLGIMVMSPGGLFAQGAIAPSSQVGVGIFIGSSFTGGGGTVQYAFTPGIHAGLEVGIAATTASESTSGNVTTSTSSMDTELGPYVRFLLEAAVNPFFQVGFRFAESSTTTSVTNLPDQTTSNSGSAIYTAFGLEGFISRNFGLYAAATILNVPTKSGSRTTFGFFSGRVGVEWFLPAN